MSMAAVHRRPPKKQKQLPAAANQRREAYSEGTCLINDDITFSITACLVGGCVCVCVWIGFTENMIKR